MKIILVKWKQFNCGFSKIDQRIKLINRVGAFLNYRCTYLELGLVSCNHEFKMPQMFYTPIGDPLSQASQGCCKRVPQTGWLNLVKIYFLTFLRLVLMLSHVQLFATPWTVAHQAPLSMGFSRQEYHNGLPFPPPGDLPNPGIKAESPALQADSLPLSHLGSPFLEARNPKSRAVSPLKLPGKNLSLFLPKFWWLSTILAIPWYTDISYLYCWCIVSASGTTWPSSLCIWVQIPPPPFFF